MGNLFSCINLFSCKKRPTSFFGHKKKKFFSNTHSENMLVPLYNNFPIRVSDLVGQDSSRSFTYNSERPYLVNQFLSPLTVEYTGSVDNIRQLQIVQDTRESPISSAC